MNRFAFLLALAPIAAPIHADEVAIASAQTVIEAALEAFEAGEYVKMERMRPPSQLRVMVEASGVSEEEYLNTRAAKVEASLEVVTIESVRLLPDSLSTLQTPTGRTYVAATVETYWRFDEDNLTRILGPMIAFEDGGNWYYTRVEKDADLSALRKAYPEFLDVEFPAQQMEQVPTNQLPEDLQ